MFKPYDHVMFATDLKEGDEQLIARAKGFSEFAGAKLSVIHVVRLIPSAYGFTGYNNYEETLFESAKNKLIKICKEVDIPEENVCVSHGTPQEDILKYAKEFKVDLIALHGQKHNLFGSLGSVAHSLINHAPCDIHIFY